MAASLEYGSLPAHWRGPVASVRVPGILVLNNRASVCTGPPAHCRTESSITRDGYFLVWGISGCETWLAVLTLRACKNQMKRASTSATIMPITSALLSSCGSHGSDLMVDLEGESRWYTPGAGVDAPARLISVPRTVSRTVSLRSEMSSPTGTSSTTRA